MQDLAHHDGVGGRQRAGEEAASDEACPVGQTHPLEPTRPASGSAKAADVHSP